MSLRFRLSFGPLAAVLLWLGVAGLGLFVPGYNPVRQTVSEIGELGSPMRVPFAVVLCATGLCLVVFASGLKRASRSAGHSALSAYFVAVMGVSAAGVGIFAFPHPLHNVFGLSELIGYQAPAVLAFTWRREMRSAIVSFSWLLYGLLMLAIAANLSVFDTHGRLWAYERPVYGLVQRSLFAMSSLWFAGAGGILMRQMRSPR